MNNNCLYNFRDRTTTDNGVHDSKPNAYQDKATVNSEHAGANLQQLIDDPLESQEGLKVCTMEYVCNLIYFSTASDLSHL